MFLSLSSWVHIGWKFRFTGTYGSERLSRMSSEPVAAARGAIDFEHLDRSSIKPAPALASDCNNEEILQLKPLLEALWVFWLVLPSS